MSHTSRMGQRLVVAGIVAVLALGLRTREVAPSGGVAVSPSRGDRLAEGPATELGFGIEEALASSCTMDDVKKSCCPSACDLYKKGRTSDSESSFNSCLAKMSCKDPWGNGSVPFKCGC